MDEDYEWYNGGGGELFSSETIWQGCRSKWCNALKDAYVKWMKVCCKIQAIRPIALLIMCSTVPIGFPWQKARTSPGPTTEVCQGWKAPNIHSRMLTPTQRSSVHEKGNSATVTLPAQQFPGLSIFIIWFLSVHIHIQIFILKKHRPKNEFNNV